MPGIEIEDGGFRVKMILDSVAPCDKRLRTIVARYPRFIHSEIMTHRDRARNAASSRAIPFPVMTARTEEDPVIPIFWGMEKKGMQTGEEIPKELRPLAKAIWLECLDDVLVHAYRLHNIDDTMGNQFVVQRYRSNMTDEEYARLEAYAMQRWQRGKSPDGEEIKIHKSIPNRMIEPWAWIEVVMTATEWENFFRLRCHPDAEIHFQKIAGMIRDALRMSEPKRRRVGALHLPFVDGYDLEELKAGNITGDDAKRISAARCARVSYLTHEGECDPAKDLALFDKLSNGSGFGHWSPMEHVAEALATPERSGPFIGWRQFRKEFPLENAEG